MQSRSCGTSMAQFPSPSWDTKRGWKRRRESELECGRPSFTKAKRAKASPEDSKDDNVTGEFFEDTAEREASESATDTSQDDDDEDDSQQGDVGEVDLADVIEEGLQGLLEKKQVVDQQIDDLTFEGLQYLENLKQAFLNNMGRIKGSFQSYHENQKQSWIDLAIESRKTEQRLDTVKDLVGELSAATSL